MSPPRAEVLQGTLDLLILRTLRLGPMHGYGLVQRLEQMTRGVFQVNPGSMFPALHKLEQHGWIEGTWGKSENNRRARYYRLTRAGEERVEEALAEWQRVSTAITRVVEGT